MKLTPGCREKVPGVPTNFGITRTVLLCYSTNFLHVTAQPIILLLKGALNLKRLKNTRPEPKIYYFNQLKLVQIFKILSLI